MSETPKHLRNHLSSDEREDVHLAGVGVFHGRDNEAGSTQCDLTLWPAVHRQRQLPLPHVEHPRKLHALRTTHTSRLSLRVKEKNSVNNTVDDPQCSDRHTQTDFSFQNGRFCTIEKLFLAIWDFVNQLSHNGASISLSKSGKKAMWLCKWIVANSLWE